MLLFVSVLSCWFGSTYQYSKPQSGHHFERNGQKVNYLLFMDDVMLYAINVFAKR